MIVLVPLLLVLLRRTRGPEPTPLRPRKLASSPGLA